MKIMLKIKEMSVDVEGKKILNNISLKFEIGKNYCVLGKNGSGKSSLAMTIMGHPNYHISKGEIFVDGISIKGMSVDERSKKGIFLAFQTIPEIKGIKLFEFLRIIYSEKKGENISFLKFKKIIEPLLLELNIDKEFLWRDLNVGFSGGERRKLEVLQIRLLEPKYIILDEIDSGLDVDAFKSVAKLLQSVNNENNSFIIITHIFSILDYISIDNVLVMKNGEIIKVGGKDIVKNIKEFGFGE